MKTETFKTTLMVMASASTLAMASTTAFAQDEAAATDVEILTVLGSRNTQARSATDSPVPIDVISRDDFNALGNSADLTDNLRNLVPSYTATPATGDGSAFIRPTSLRGMAPDQTLVLVNGKRRHRSALVQFFAPAAGNGAHGPDVGMIPGLALQRVEVLRDGAAAQYGSDAIAGVINFAAREDSEGAEIVAQYGQFYEGEVSYRVAGNAGFALGENGFLNITAEYTDNEALSRGIQRPDAQALIDGGTPGVGADSPFGDAPLVQTWGRPETSGLRTFFNAGIDLNGEAELYSFGNYAETEGRYRFFYRSPTHSSLVPLRTAGFTGLQAGYTPFLDGDQTDLSLVAGLRGERAGISFDFSVGYGLNELDYFLNNTINPSLGLVGGQPAQRDFDVGGYEQEEHNFNADFSRALSDNMNLGFGFEWRQETYIVNAGEPNSYQGSGSNGFGGIRPGDAGDFDRENTALYVDLEHDISDSFLMQYAVRYEDFSDFGSTLNGKIAARYNVSDTFTLRGAVSTGFHAPTPGQANVRTTITTFDGTTGLQVEEGLVPATNPLAILAGGAPLTEERSVNYSFGFSNQIGEATSLTVDFYRIEVDDRIYRTGDIQPQGPTGPTISFYTNALDIESQGVDVVLTSGFDWSGGANTDVTVALNYNQLEVVGQSPVGGINPVSAATIEDIENNYPELRFVATANTYFGENWNLLVRANYYGEHYDERGTIDGTPGNRSALIDQTVYIDAELGYDVSDSLRLVFGATNLFDSYVDEIANDGTFANRVSVGLPYPRRSAANYEGGSWYLRATKRF
ncbi:MAG: TonB-dependent receptor [Pseudomonadota bacterium]|nr:TonB-dependent receptor [Pseudomonadota bacterium]